MALSGPRIESYSAQHYYVGLRHMVLLSLGVIAIIVNDTAFWKPFLDCINEALEGLPK